ncbi:YHS domain-containing (seleno)protein [Litorimonas sp.]|jgi:YHS domain-containing protein|uniref:YHS domain-containing (seleno)protein n=1 Tax=Litorimonas sp. TaxID=1892381 RepID=UPI003A84E9D6
MKLLLISTALFGWVSLTPLAAQAADDPIYTSWRNNLALGGYDAVSFFSGNPQKGEREFSTIYKGARWYFQTEANRDLFVSNPSAFEPQFGGYCAWAISKGKLARGSPSHWYVEDGKLYLNFSERIRDRWLADKNDFISIANSRWPEILE